MKTTAILSVWLLFISATAMADVGSQENASPWSNVQFRTYSEQAATVGDRVPWAFPQKDWSLQYKEASIYERTVIGSRIGDQGSALYAKTERLETILRARDKTVSQGPDCIYRDPRTGKLVVLESKGGRATPQETYGFRQGTIENTVRSAEEVLKWDITPKERKAYSLVLEEAAKGNLEVRVIVTPHDDALPGRPLVKSTAVSNPRSQQFANDVIADLCASRPDLPENPRLARVRAYETTFGGGANIGLGIWLMLDTAAPAYDDLVASLDPASRSRASILRLGKSGSLFLSGASLTIAGSSQLATRLIANKSVRDRLTTLSEWSWKGGFVLALTAEGFVLWEYSEGQIDGRQAGTFTASLIGGFGGDWAGAVAGASSGAAIGAGFGVWFDGIGAAPGAAIGGAIGGVTGAFAGGWGGSAFAGWAADTCFQIRDDAWGQKQRVDILQFLTSYYSAN